MIVMGWYLPYVRVQRRARLRLEQIDREVPELVDLLVTTVEGGVGFAAGLQLASRSIEGPLGQELRLALREQSLGLTPEEALRNLSLRVDSPATRAFTQALVQGESLGVSIGTILRDLASDMRKRRRQSAEERAQKTPTKILFPLIALILPAMFIVTLGPVMMEAVRLLRVGLMPRLDAAANLVGEDLQEPDRGEERVRQHRDDDADDDCDGERRRGLDAVAERSGADLEQEQRERDADDGALHRGGRGAGPAEIRPEGERRRAQRERHQQLTCGHLVSPSRDRARPTLPLSAGRDGNLRRPAR